MIGDSDWRSVLAEAEHEARQTFPVGYVTSLYSSMVALTSTAHRADLDQLQAVGTYALTTVTHNDWKRRVDQIIQTAELQNVELRAFP